MATIRDFGIPGVGDGILQPKLKNRWRVTFSGIGGSVSSIELSKQAINVTRPQLNFDEVQLDRYNTRAWVAGKYNFEPITLTFEDDLRSGASLVLQEQIQQQQFLIGAEGQFLETATSGADYKFATILDLLDGGENVVESWVVEGCWIQNIDYTDLDYSASEAVQITVSLRYDMARQEFGSNDGAGFGDAMGGAGTSSTS